MLIVYLFSDHTSVQVEIVGWVPGLAVDARLEVQMGCRGVARLAYGAITWPAFTCWPSFTRFFELWA